MRLLPYGPAALLVEVDDTAAVRSLYVHCLTERAAGRLEAADVVPAARTVLLSGISDAARARAAVEAWRPTSTPPPQGPLVTVDVRYAGADLSDVARTVGLTPQEVVDLHAGADYEVAFCGFLPGFAYLVGLPQRLHLPRRPIPRTSVPAGSVAIAGEYAGVYPRRGPGGWHLLGTTDAVLFDLDREPAALLQPGTRVRFRQVAR